MKCTVITPVGPGHDGELLEECQRSICQAADYSHGPFARIDRRCVFDLQGRFGRSAARNQGVREAVATGADWLFFLDADDLLLPEAFALVTPYVRATAGPTRAPQFDAIWGAICEQCPGHTAKLRERQNARIASLQDVLRTDPFYSLQMGHFVRAEIAAAHPFNEQLDAGEDFDYYLRVWSTARCVKIAEPLFINRRGLHSSGPRRANGRQWREAVRKIIAEYRDR